MRALNFRIEGMHCQGCADRVQKVLRRQPAVLDTHVGLREGMAQVWVRDDSTPDNLIAIIRQVGFEAEPVKSSSRKLNHD